MNYKLFITSNYVYKMSVIESNVDADLITKFIWKAQDLNIQSVLGQNLYTKMLNDTPTYVGLYNDLMIQYIQPALCEWVVYHLIPFINFRLTNKAVSQKSSDNSQPTATEDLNWLRSQVRNNAEFYNERMKDFIKNNPTAFPEFYQSDLSFRIKPAITNYFSGIYTKGRNYQGPYPPLDNINTDDFCCD